MSNDPTLKPIAETVANLPLCPCAQREALRAALSLPDKPFRCGFDPGGRQGIEHHIRRCVRSVVDDEANIGVLSTGEQIAVALVLNRFDFLNRHTMLEALDRLGNDWTSAALQVARDGWE